jgi:hypothetical protein
MGAGSARGMGEATGQPPQIGGLRGGSKQQPHTHTHTPAWHTKATMGMAHRPTHTRRPKCTHKAKSLRMALWGQAGEGGGRRATACGVVKSQGARWVGAGDRRQSNNIRPR